jgi:BirA family transcriptional regulator, biotin operon repressor / biotin---[acetyl-CoA-carboxylase] ligase
LRSNRSEPLPAEFEEALTLARPRLGRLASTVLFFPTIGSTNDVASQLADRGGHEGAVVVADEQTAGRGRRGRTWFSPPASGLYVSVVLTPGRGHRMPDRATTLTTLAAGVALAEGVEHVTGLCADIKWPNDLLVGRRKLAGILAEAIDVRRPVLEPLDAGADGPGERRRADAPSPSRSRDTIQEAGETRQPHVVLGYGINVRSAAYPPELGDRVTSLESELGRTIDRAALFAESLVALARRYDDLLAGRFDAILDAWRARAPASRGARVSWTAAPGLRTGVTAGIDDQGALLVQAGDRVERIVAGEVTWL